MKKGILVIITLAVTLLAAACSPAPTPTPTQPPPPLPPTLPPRPTATAVPPTATLVPPTAVPPTSAPQSTVSSPQAATAAATSIPATATATSAPPTVAATGAPAASPLAPPGLYVTNMRLDPPQPIHGQEISYFVSFLNTAATDQNPKWVVYIYRADNPGRPNTQTSVTQTTIQPGALEMKAPSGVIKFGATGNACDFYFARVDLLDTNNKGTDMVKPDGSTFEKGFTVCQ